MNQTDSPDHLDHSFELDLETVKARAIRGIAIITGRGFIVNIISQVSVFFLITFMSPEEMGIFWVVNAAVFFLVYFSDIGLAAALIQKKEKITPDDLKTTFTTQQSLIISLLVLLFIFSPRLAEFYELNQEGIYLLYAVGFSLLLASLKSIPTVLMERKLEFGKMAIPEILENFAYSVFVVYFAWAGYGLRAFTYAVLIRGIVGVVTIYMLEPWMPKIGFSKKALKGLFSFGVPYQLNTLISVFKDRGMTLIMGKVIGNAGVGFLGTAERFSQMPLRLFMDPVTRVSFPAFSRMQDHKRELANTTTRTIFFITFLTYPVLVGMVLVLPIFMEVFPVYQKWEASVIPLGFMVINVFFAAATTLLTNLLAAIGKIKTVTKLVTMWTVLTIIFVPTLGYMYGVNGAAAGYAIVSSSSIIAIFVAKRHVNFSITEGAGKTFLASILMGVCVYISKLVLSNNFTNMIIMIAIGGVSYLGFSYLLYGQKLFTDAKRLTKVFLGRK